MDFTFTSLLKESWQTYMDNFAKIWKIYIFLFIPSVFFSLSEFFMNDGFSNAGTAAIWVAFVVAGIFTILVSIAYLLQVRNVIEGKDDSIQNLFIKATPLFWAYTLTSLLQLVLLGVAALFLVIPAVILGVYWIFMRETVVYRKKRYVDALDYSFTLVRGRWWKVLGIFLGFGLITVGPNLVLALALEQLGMFGALISLLVVFFLSAWISIAQVMLFFALEKTAKYTPSQVPRLLGRKITKKRTSTRGTKRPSRVKKRASKKSVKKPTRRKAKKSTKRKSVSKKRRKR